MSCMPDTSPVRILQPQLRRTSEIRYHSDLAPGQRFVFVGRIVDPICRLYVVGRRVDRVPANQPEWLDDHRHNCPTFYVLIGQNPDLTGLTAEIVIEGRPFVAEAPSAIMLPAGFLHHHRLSAGSGWSFHVNVRPDYEESLMDLESDAMPHVGDVDVDRLYRRAERAAPSARRWEIEDGAIEPDSANLPNGSDTTPTLWTFIDPDQFLAPGIRLHAQQLSSRMRGWNEAMHRHSTDEVTVVLADGDEQLHLVVEATTGRATRAKANTVEAPASLYVPAGVEHRCRHLGGDGLALKFLRLGSGID
jgi:mannose-6-phosphate isomerase-like protein (cupin superfamily)